ncbi:hypothetical protein GCM10029978_046520 [Actinoallomurus acanthiterrae]
MHRNRQPGVRTDALKGAAGPGHPVADSTTNLAAGHGPGRARLNRRATDHTCDHSTAGLFDTHARARPEPVDGSGRRVGWVRAVRPGV